MSIVVAAGAGVQIATSWLAPVIGSGLAAAATPALEPGLAAAATPALGPGFAAAATPALGPGLAAAATPVLAQSERALFEWTWVVDNREAILEATVEHLFLTASAVVAGLALSLVLCVFALRNRRLLEPILAVGNLLYTLPSLAAFALLAPFTGLTSTTAIIALTSYTVLILVRNIVTGIDGVPADVVEAAAGMGYRPARILLEIELPLALPVIIAGVRIAAVTVIGLVTVTALLGLGGLGQFILRGFRVLPPFPTLILVGTFLSVVLAVAVDLALLGVERALTPWSRRNRVAA